jgi:hypothetical protein
MHRGVFSTCAMTQGLIKIGAFKKNYRIVILINERYKTKDFRLLNERLWSSNTRDSLYSKMRYLLVTKCLKRGFLL